MTLGPPESTGREQEPRVILADAWYETRYIETAPSASNQTEAQMTTIGGSTPAAVEIGEVSAPPFVRLPDLSTMFDARARRLLAIAEGHEMEGFLHFMAQVAGAQHAIASQLSDPEPVDPQTLEEALQQSRPVLSKGSLDPGRDYELILDAIIARLAAAPKPAAAELERLRLASGTPAWRKTLAKDLLNDMLLPENAGVSFFVAAALQVLFARLAAALPAGELRPVGDGICPCCGSHPLASMVVGWKGAQNTRFLHCALCAVNWHYVRIKCAHCSSTKGIAYYGLEQKNPLITAETCEECRNYLKILQNHKDPSLEPMADDLATLGLDIKLREAGWSRFGYNPFLLEC